MVQKRYSIVILLLLFTVSFLPADVPKKEYEIKKLAEGVYGFLWKNPLQDPIEGNSLFIINDRDVVVVDAGLFHTSTRLMIKELKKLTSKPVRYVVNTHFHDDHNNGNFVYREEWTGVEFIAQKNTREDIIEKVINARPQDIQGFRDNIAMYDQWIKDGKDAAGKPVDEARKGRINKVIDLYKQSINEYNSVKDAPPDLTYQDSLVLYRGSRTIKILWLGKGNTRGDAVVYLPNERIIATGDLVVYPSPFAFGSYYKEWITTLSRIDSLNADMLFPGHGPVFTDKQYLHNVQGLLTALVHEVEKSAVSGLSLDETKKQVTLSEWKEKFSAKDVGIERAFDQFFLAPAVERAWHQAKGDKDGE